MNDHGSDRLLTALDRLATTSRQPGEHPRADIALTQAIDHWVGLHAAEHNQSQRYTSVDDRGDPLGTCIAHLVAAVGHLTRTARPGLTVPGALCEAIEDWIANRPTRPEPSAAAASSPGPR
jgi:hypothetical protein